MDRGVLAGRAGILAACAASWWAAVGRAGDDAVYELVRHLGDASYAVRREAAAQLRQLGPTAQHALREARDSEQLEVRRHAARLLEDLQRAEQLRRIDAFAKAEPGPGDHDLPGWPRFQQSVGDDRTSRQLFVDMHRAEPWLFRLLAEDEPFGALLRAYESRCVELEYDHTHGRSPANLAASVGALLFIGSEGRLEISDSTAGAICHFVHDREFCAALSNGRQGALLRKLVCGWVAQPGGAAAYHRMRLAMRNGLPEGIVPALTVIRQSERPWSAPYAVLTIGKLGGAEHLAELEPLFHDRAEYGTSDGDAAAALSTQLGDVALAAALHLTGQDPVEYGFERLKPSEHFLFELSTVGFAREADRVAAFEQWRRWKSAQDGTAKER